MLADAPRNARDAPRSEGLRDAPETADAIHRRRSVGLACAQPARRRELEKRREAALAQVVRDRRCELER